MVPPRGSGRPRPPGPRKHIPANPKSVPKSRLATPTHPRTDQPVGWVPTRTPTIGGAPLPPGPDPKNPPRKFVLFAPMKAQNKIRRNQIPVHPQNKTAPENPAPKALSPQPRQKKICFACPETGWSPPGTRFSRPNGSPPFGPVGIVPPPPFLKPPLALRLKVPDGKKKNMGTIPVNPSLQNLFLILQNNSPRRAPQQQKQRRGGWGGERRKKRGEILILKI